MKTTKKISKRNGFTLIELLMTVTIIAVLIGLLMPALSGVRNSVAHAEARVGISNIENAIASFSVQFGQAPPSTITLYEDPNDWSLDSLSRSKIVSIWPKFDFRLVRDFNGDGTYDDRFTLKGDQCLALFLGGVWSEDTGFRGFFKSPTAPFGFINDNAGNYLGRRSSDTVSMDGPYLEFDLDRIITVTETNYPYWEGSLNGLTTIARINQSTEWFPVYEDTFGEGRPYLYSKAYEVSGYNDIGVGINRDINTPLAMVDNPGMGFQVYGRLLGNPPRLKHYKTNQFQIVSAGPDGNYGFGGDALPPRSLADHDNVTNFTSGRIDSIEE